MRSGEVTEAIAKLLRGKGYCFGDERLLLKRGAAVKSLKATAYLKIRTRATLGLKMTLKAKEVCHKLLS